MRFARTGQDIIIVAEAISDTAYQEYKTTPETLTAYGSDDGAAFSAITGVTVVWDANGDMFRITIPADQCPAEGHMFYGVVDWTGIIDIKFEFYMTNAETNITAIKAITDLLTLAAIKTQVDTAISDAGIVTKIDTVDTVVDGIATTLATPANFMADVSSLATSAEVAALSNIAAVGAEKIVPADKYAFDASAKTLTFSSPYDTLTVEQVTFIKNLTTNYIIWDCRYAGYQTLPIRFGAAPNTHVLSFDSSDSDAANTDKIMIVVNQV